MSKSILKRFLPVLLLSFLTFTAIGQEIKIKGEINKDWQYLETQEGVSFHVRKVECNVIEGKKPLIYTFLKLTNETNQDKIIHFNYGLQFKEGCSGCDNDSEFTVDLILPAMSQVEGDCEFKNHFLSRLIVNPNLGGGWAFEYIILTDLNIELFQ